MSEDFFPSKLAVLRYLQPSYKISQSRFYQHCGDKDHPALLLPDPQTGHFSRAAVDAYARQHLREKATGKKKNAALEERQRKKMDAEARLAEIRAEREAHRLAIDQKKYMPREDFAREVAARAVFLKRNLSHAIETQSLELIHLVEGKPALADMLVDYLDKVVDNALTEFCSTDTFHVLFLADEEPGQAKAENA